MKKLVIAILLLTVIGIAATAVAGDQAVRFNTTTLVAGTKVAPGEYTLRYDIKGTTVDVKVMQGNKEVVTVKGVLIDKKDPSPYNSIVHTANADGTNNLTEIQMANKKQVIRLDVADTAVGK
jgi:hypothetical protein